MGETLEQTYKRILVGLDGSPQANYAFECAIEVARRNQGEVIAVAIIQNQMYDLIGYGNVNEQTLQLAANEYKGLLDDVRNWAESIDFHDVRTEVVFGQPKTLLAETLPKKYEADLVMVGQSGLNTIERFMVGSVAAYVSTHAKCDVLVVHEQKEHH